jgi:hypothetical protein
MFLVFNTCIDVSKKWKNKTEKYFLTDKFNVKLCFKTE